MIEYHFYITDTIRTTKWMRLALRYCAKQATLILGLTGEKERPPLDTMRVASTRGTPIVEWNCMLSKSWVNTFASTEMPYLIPVTYTHSLIVFAESAKLVGIILNFLLKSYAPCNMLQQYVTGVFVASLRPLSSPPVETFLKYNQDWSTKLYCLSWLLISIL